MIKKKNQKKMEKGKTPCYKVKFVYLFIIFLISCSSCYGENIGGDTTIIFSTGNSQIEINYFSQEPIYLNLIKGYYFFIKVNSNYNPSEKISSWIKLLDRNGKPLIPKFKYVEFETLTYNELDKSNYGIIYYIIDGSEIGIHEIKIFDKDAERNENLNIYRFKANDSKQFKILNFKKNVIVADYLFTNNKQDTSLFSELNKDSLANDLNGFFLYDELRLKNDLYSKKIETSNYFALLSYYDSIYKNGKKDVKFLYEYSTILEKATNSLFQKQEIDSTRILSEKLYSISLNDSSLFNFEVASKYFMLACEYKNIQNDDNDNKFTQIIKSIEDYEIKFKQNLNYKYKFYLLLGNIKYLMHKDDDARFFYNKIIESEDASEETKQKAIKNYELIKPNN